jgi:hypothetical protein
MITDIGHYYQRRGARFNFKIRRRRLWRRLFFLPGRPLAASFGAVENAKNAVTREYVAISGNTRSAADFPTG